MAKAYLNKLSLPLPAVLCCRKSIYIHLVLSADFKNQKINW